MPPRTIAVAQASVESAAIAYAARELAQPGDAILLVHAARVLSPESVVLHSAPHTTYAVGEGGGGGGSGGGGGGDEVQALHDKVARVVEANVLSVAEKLGVPAALQVRLLSVDATAGDVAEAVVAAAKEEGAAMLVLARAVRAAAEAPDGSGRGATPAADADGAASDSGVEDCSTKSTKGSSGFLVGLAERARARAQQLVSAATGSLPLEQEVLKRTGAGLPVVLVPLPPAEADGKAAPAGGSGGGGGGAGGA